MTISIKRSLEKIIALWRFLLQAGSLSCTAGAMQVSRQLRLIYGGTALVGFANQLLLFALEVPFLPYFYILHVLFFAYAAFKATICLFVPFYCAGLAIIILQSALSAHFLGDDCAVQLYLLSMLMVVNYIYVTPWGKLFRIFFIAAVYVAVVGSYIFMDNFLSELIRPHRIISDLTEMFFTLINTLGSLALFSFTCSVFASSYQKEFHRLQSLNEDLRQSADRDGLTGLYNRSGFFSATKSMLNPKVLTGGEAKTCCAVICDIDFFKRINDSYGHEAGDLVLQRLSAFFSGFANEYMIVCRWGGEEFVLLLQARLQTVYSLMEEMRRNIENTVIKFYNHDLKVTMSFGIAERQGEESLGAMIRRADHALYRAKESGRNQVRCAPDVVEDEQD